MDEDLKVKNQIGAIFDQFRGNSKSTKNVPPGDKGALGPIALFDMLDSMLPVGFVIFQRTLTQITRKLPHFSFL